MALTFTLIDEAMSRLWDTATFDVTRFKVDGLRGERPAGVDIVREFLRDAISQRSLCTLPDPWGNAGGLHGPFFIEKMEAEWYRPVSFAQLQQRVTAILNDPKWNEPPSPEQRLPVAQWLEAVAARGDDVFFVLDAPDSPDVKVEWAWIWWIFQEFVSFSPNRDEMTVAFFIMD